MNEKKITIKIPARHLEWIKKNYRKARQGTNSLFEYGGIDIQDCLLYTSPSPRDGLLSRMPSSA